MKPSVYCPVVVLLQSFVLLSQGSILTPKSYDGYQVLRIKIETEDQLNAFWNLAEVDFWNEPAVGRWCDVMVSSTNLPRVMQHLQHELLDSHLLIADVGSLIQPQNPSGDATKDKGLTTTFWTDYQRLSSIFDWMDSLETSYGNLVSTQTIGQSYEERPIRLLKISKSNPTNSSRPAVFLDSGIHAREWISPATLTFVIDSLIRDDQYADIWEILDLHIVPVLNPDGYEYTHTADRMWRKNRRPNQGTNCFGTDLNRNFPFEWCTLGASNNSCSDIYCGSAPGSEPETRVVMDYLLQDLNWWGYVSVHSYAQEWCIPWAYTADPAPDYDDMWAIGRKAVDALEAVHGTPYTLKVPSGRYGGFSIDWAKGVLNIKYPVLIELRDTGTYGFLLPPEQIIPSGQETLAAIVVYLREIIREIQS